MSEAIRLIWLHVHDRAPLDNTAHGILDEADLKRARRFTVEQPRRIFVAARAALRATLGAELGLDPGSLRFTFGAHGKPRLDPRSDLDFNIAHSGSTVVIALAYGTAVGVDVEEMSHTVPALRLARRYFTETEAQAVASAPEGSRLRVFHHCWTAKEAVLKATGSGLTVSVHSIEVDPDPDGAPRVRSIANDPGAARDWRLLRHERPGEWMATVAHRGPQRDLHVSEFPGS